MLRRLVLATILVPVVASAQVTERSAVVDLLDRITADINDLRYAEAIAAGSALAARSAVLPVALRTRLHLLMGAAYFPEDRALQRPDSARAHLVRAIQQTPDANYPAELRWRGLDSLLSDARGGTTAAALRVAARQPIGGPGAEARLAFAATRGTTVELRVVRRANERIVFADTLAAESGEFMLAAHDGAQIVTPTGAYDLVLLARGEGSGEVVTRTYAAVVEAPAIVLDETPELPGDALLPERAVPQRARLLRTGLIAGAATAGLAVLGRFDADLRDAVGPDPRGLVAGGAIAMSVAWYARRQEEVPLPANVVTNAATRAAHARAIEAVRERNAAKLAGFSGTLVTVTDVP